MVWINRDFFLLWTGQLVSQLGDRFYSIALLWWVLEKTNSPGIMGLFLAASLLPEILFGLVAGGYIDRWNRKSIIIAADIFRGLAVLAVTLLSWLGQLEIWHVFAASVVISLASAFFNPTVMAIIPRLVNKDQLTRANSLSEMTAGLSTVAGPVLGATLVSFLGYEAVFLINGASFLISALAECFIALPVPDRSGECKNSLIGDIKDGFRFISGNKPVFIILLVIGAVHMLFGCLLVAMPLLAKTLAGNGIRNLGLLETAMGVGMILGAVVTGGQKLQKVKGGALFAVIAAAGLCFTVMGVASGFNVTYIPPYIALMALIGAAAATASVFWRSLLQIHVPDEMAGRVFSVSTVIADVTLPLSFGVFGAVLTWFSPALALAACGISLMATGAALIIKYGKMV